MPECENPSIFGAFLFSAAWKLSSSPVAVGLAILIASKSPFSWTIFLNSASAAESNNKEFQIEVLLHQSMHYLPWYEVSIFMNKWSRFSSPIVRTVTTFIQKHGHWFHTTSLHYNIFIHHREFWFTWYEIVNDQFFPIIIVHLLRFIVNTLFESFIVVAVNIAHMIRWGHPPPKPHRTSDSILDHMPHVSNERWYPPANWFECNSTCCQLIEFFSQTCKTKLLAVDLIILLLSIDIEVSRLAIGFQKNCIIRLPQCTNTTLYFASCIAHLLAAYHSNSICTSLV